MVLVRIAASDAELAGHYIVAGNVGGCSSLCSGCEPLVRRVAAAGQAVDPHSVAGPAAQRQSMLALTVPRQ